MRHESLRIVFPIQFPEELKREIDPMEEPLGDYMGLGKTNGFPSLQSRQ